MFVNPGSTREPGPKVTIHCPTCGQRDVPATTYDQTDHGEGDVATGWTTSWVICINCRRAHLCRRRVKELAHLSADEIAPLITPYTSLVSRVLALVALLLFFVPIVSPVLGLLAVLGNRWPGIWKKLSWVGLGLALAAHAGYGVLFLMEK